MKEDNILLEKSFAFAIRTVKVYQYLCQEKREFVLSKQLLRAGTSIGANANEAVYSSSKKDFINKLHISLKETNETIYWIKLLSATEYLTQDMENSLLTDGIEIRKMLTSIVKTTKDSMTD